ncbi:MAG: Gfo/Idh/MocA family oxidoreductase [Planctomycetes bacterium]|nr:Gfo/Idh/MocA family oxidoreductase [Planctomycetota bacterium]
MHTTNASRREFLRGSVAAAAGAIALPTVIPSRALGRRAPSNRIVLASLGVGSRGTGVLNGFLRNRDDAQAVAVCDPFRSKRERAKAMVDQFYGNADCAAYEHYEDVLARADIDAVLVTSCDHWHVHLAIAAIRAGKDVYVEKPLSPSLGWSWELRRVAEQHHAIFQYGTQQRSSTAFRRACELVRNGYVGEVERVEAWCPDAAADWNDFSVERYGSVEPEPVPEDLNYELWTGPAPLRPYSADRVRREGSFHVYDTSLGFIAGWGAHPLDIAQWGLDMDHSGPVRYAGTGALPDRGLLSTVEEWDVRCTYANGVEMRFLSARLAEPVVKGYRARWSDHGTTFFGTEGWLSVDRGGIEYGDQTLADVQLRPDDTRLYASPAHDRNFLDCVRSRQPTVSPLEAAIRSDTISHLAQLAVRTGRVVEWDPAKETAADPFIHSMLDRPQRAPYRI